VSQRVISIYLSLGFQVFIVGSDGFGLEKLEGSGDGQLRQGKSALSRAWYKLSKLR